MISSFLHECDQAQKPLGLSGRALLTGLPRSTIQRWRARQRAGVEPVQKPGPKKAHAPDWPALLASIRTLSHARLSTAGTTALLLHHRDAISRRDLQHLVQEERDHRLHLMPRIHWLKTGTAWSIDATEYDGTTLVPLVDLASRYRFEPLVTSVQSGERIAAFLDATFVEHGPPLFLKRDNGSPFNCRQVDVVLAAHKVLPLNNPPHYPPYNGAIEKSIGDFKRRLTQHLQHSHEPPSITAAVATTTHQMNHQPRRCLAGRTVCDLFHDPGRRQHWNRPARDRILQLLTTRFRDTLQSMADKVHLGSAATVWRRTVEFWLRRQGLIRVRPQTKNP